MIDPPRTLADFEPLPPAEAQVLRALRTGTIAKLGLRRPHDAEPRVRLRGAFLSFLARGGAGVPAGGAGLQIVGACISGRFDLSGSTAPMSVWFYRCLFLTAPRLDRAHVVGSASFADCALPGLRAEACRVDEHLSFGAGCQVDGEVRIARARIGRDLDCERLQMSAGAAAEHGFIADDVRVGGDVVLCGGFESAGEVRFVAAQIGGSVRAAQARLAAAIDGADQRGIALNLDLARVVGSVCLDAGFSAAGQVRLQQAAIGGDLNCAGAAFDVVGDASWGDHRAALLLDRARIGGALILEQLQEPLQGASLIDAQAGTLSDDATSWGIGHALDGFAYRRLGDDAPSDAAMRVDWLERQRAGHLGRGYRPEPWRRLVKVLRRMGRSADARGVAIGRERHLRRAGLIGGGVPRGMRWLALLAHDVYGVLAGYGQRPLRPLGLAAAVWLLCAALYWGAAEQGAIVAGAVASRGAIGPGACPAGCVEAPARASFQPLLYSLDVLVPLVDLQQARRWVPAPWPAAAPVEAVIGLPLLRLLTWLEALCGWLAALLLLASAIGVADRDRAL